VRLTNKNTDADLQHLLKNDSERAFEKLFNRYSERIFNFAFTYLKNHSECEELVQDVFVKLWQNRSKIDASRNIKSYIFKIAVNSIYDLARKNKQKEIYQKILKDDYTQTEDSTWNEVVYNELTENLNNLIDKLPTERKKIFKLSRVENLSSKEIAHKLNLSQRTVENQLYRTVKYLRQKIDKESYLMLLLFFLY
jgi:RNA polymerase sigma-70 factor (ECF subfamily)